MSKQEKIVVTSPIGEIKWCKFVTPDEKYKKYTTDIILNDSEEVQKILSQISEIEETMLEEEISKAKPQNKKKVKLSGNSCIEAEYDDEGEETGRYILKLRQNSEYTCKKTGDVKKLFPPKIFDAKAKEITGDAKSMLTVYNGSKGRIQFTLSPYFVPAIGVGVSARPLALQITELIDTMDGSGGGFEALEGGFEASFEPANSSDDGDF